MRGQFVDKEAGDRHLAAFVVLRRAPPGNAHYGKSAERDPVMLMLGSVAFGNVARAVLGFALDNEAEDGSCVITTVKNNLGRLDLPSLRYRIDETTIETDERPASVGRLVMLGESDRSVHDILRDRGNSAKDDVLEFRSVDVWLTELLTEGPMWATDV